MLLIVLVLCVSFAFVGRRISSFHKQQAAIAAFKQHAAFPQAGTGASFFLGNVQFLQLTGNHNDDGLRRLGDFPGLVSLNVNCPSITNDGLEYIGRKKSLTMLNLVGTSINDDGLKHLAELDNLVVLWLNNTEVSEEGVKKLRAALPNCDIRFGSGPGPW